MSNHRSNSSRRDFRRYAAGLLAGALFIAGCEGAALGGGAGDAPDDGPIDIGLLVPQSGTYASLGEDMQNAFEMYLDLNDGELGGREVNLVTADEGETADSGQAAAEQLVRDDEVLAVSGIVNSAVMNAVQDLIEDDGVPLVGSNASPTTLVDVEYIWRTSYVNDEPGLALGEYVADEIDGPVYLLAADYQAGYDEVEGFRETFEPAGGEVEDEVYTPFPDTTNFQPYLSQIANSDAEAVYVFYAGGAAIDFVQQYSDFGLADELPLYAPGFLTEGDVLDAQADSAEGMYTSMNYVADLDNEQNELFASEFQDAFDYAPTTYAAASYDAAHVLDLAIADVMDAGDDLTRDTLNAAIGELGEIDSPRGPWSFNDNGTPIQMWYLREVTATDDGFENTTLQDLIQLGDH